MERVDYGYGTLAEAALTPETGSAMIQSTLPADWSAVVDPASGLLRIFVRFLCCDATILEDDWIVLARAPWLWPCCTNKRNDIVFVNAK